MNFSKILPTLIPEDTDRTTKDKRSRMRTFVDWALEARIQLDQPGWFAQYTDELRNERGLSDNSIVSFHSAVRSILREKITDQVMHKLLRENGMPETEIDAAIGRMLQEIDSRNVKITTHPAPQGSVQLPNDSDVSALLNSIDVSELMGLRDYSVIALMVTTGIGPQEVGAIDVVDLHQQNEGQPVLHVPDKVRCTERLIPYGYDAWVLHVMETWLEQAGIEEGSVFRGFYKGGRKLRKGSLSPRAVERLVGNYPVLIYENPVVLKTHDLRQAYARHIFRLGNDIDTIREYLGYSTEPPVLNLLRGIIYEPQTGEPYDVDLWRF